MKIATITSALALLVSISALGGNDLKTIKQNTPKPINITDFDPTIKPGDDFFDYINSKWIKSTPIPADKSRWGGFDMLQDQSTTAVKKILENAAYTKVAAPKGSNIQLLGDFYRSAMDTITIDKAGAHPLDGYAAQIKAATSKEAIGKLLGDLQTRDIKTPFGFYVQQDAKNSTRYIIYLTQDGLGLPDRDYYTRNDPHSLQVLEEYKKFVTNTFKLTGQANPEQQMQNVLEIENILAKASMTKVELRDPEKQYNIFTVDQLKKTYTNIDWDAFFKVLNTKPFNEVNVDQPAFLRVYDSILPIIPHDKWVSYQYFHLVNSNARYLSSPLVNNRFDFFGKVLSGTTVIEPRWKRVSYVAGNYMRDLIGQEYVKTNFSPNAKSRALELVENLRATLSERIDKLTWMNDTTKAKAQEKLSKIMVKVGYPDKWWSYDGLDVKNQPYVLNVLACTERENRRVLEKIGSPIDRTEWGMGPQTVNAYYNPLLNEIVFPAAILQPPFFYEFGDDAVNYGGIGMVIGHEITHGFDDEGSQFDAEGNLANWWTAGDRQNYENMTDRFVKQYNQYNVVDSLNINGELTLGENIADLGGMNITYSAMQKALSNKKVGLIDGLTPEQRFFINYAIIWRDHARPEYQKQLIYTDPHSPAKFRVNGVLSNFPEFYKAFGVTPDSKMYTKEQDMSKMW